MIKLYCVEDDMGIRSLITCALQSGGYEAEGFDCGKPFFEAMKQALPQLILLDIMLPDEDGISILHKLKSDPVTEKIPVIMLSAKSSEIDKVTGLEAGADDYITKPFGVMELLSRIKAVLRRSGNLEKEPALQKLTVQELALDEESRTVEYKGKNVNLTFREFELLSFLLKNKGIAISRNVLLERVWGFQYEGETRTVDVHVKTIRRKLEAVGCEDFIQTVRGYGYKVEG